MKSSISAATLRDAWFSRQNLGLLFGLLLMTLIALPAWADPPARIGRLGEMNGQVWIYDNDTGEWAQAVRNRPVTTGDRVSTEANGRAEIHVGSTVLRLASNSEVEMLQLDDDHTSLQLHGGSLSARIRTDEAAREFGVATEEGRFRTARPGNYRFDNLDDISAATSWSGQAVFEGEGTEMAVQAGQRAEFWKQNGTDQYSRTEPKRDDFWNWVTAQDGKDSRSVATRYVSSEMTGVEDLDRYGRWDGNTEYGALWIPTAVPVNWAPYRMGHWAWVNPWGWTWVDDAPWGFAPFHYGRWVWYRERWGWAPGRYVARPVYAPALVAWVGGPNLSVSISTGRAPTVGWFPLGPREVYVPSYRVSERYVRQVNVTHVTNITNVTTIVNSPGTAMANGRYVNRGLPHAVTVVPATVVQRRQEVAPAMTAVNDRVLRDMSRERPRADAPIAGPQRPAPGAARPDPRVSRPGAIAQVVQQQQQQPQRPPQSAPNQIGGQQIGRPVGQAPDQPRRDRDGDGQPNRRDTTPRAVGNQRPGMTASPTVQPAPAATITAAPPANPAQVQSQAGPDRQRAERPRREREQPGVRVPDSPPTTAPPVANAPPPMGRPGPAARVQSAVQAPKSAIEPQRSAVQAPAPVAAPPHAQAPMRSAVQPPAPQQPAVQVQQPRERPPQVRQERPQRDPGEHRQERGDRGGGGDRRGGPN